MKYQISKIKYQKLREQYPKFIYEKFEWKIINNDLKIVFNFSIEPGVHFKPEIIIKNIGRSLLKSNFNKLDNLIFHLGLMEIPSYWKATCSPEILIKAGSLNQKQINFWKDLIMNGMGQFFYENKIDFKKANFLKIISQNPEQNLQGSDPCKLKNRVLVPVGGGKDSAVTLELLNKTGKTIRCFSLNPTDSALKIMKIAGCKHPIIVRRKIDEKLLELNRRGFLNGHTPFSAYLAFLTVICAVIFDYKYIALSNEKSANEGNLTYLGKIINHQWSKSLEFEKKFQQYSKKYLAKNIHYFSYLRNLYEIEIAEKFSKYPKYFDAFLSCNEAYKTASGTKKPSKKWCGRCSKCLFAFLILYPFVEEKILVNIFGKNLFEDRNLLPIMQQLIGERGFKPFECVGTKKECKRALILSIKKAEKLRKVPFLLDYFKELIYLTKIK